VVTLTINGKDRADIKAGDTVEFTANIVAPPNAGKIVEAEWDFDGAGAYPRKETFDGSKAKENITLKTQFTFSEPGTYFPTLRVASEKNGDANSEYAQVLNLGRVRVVVK